MLVKRMLFAVLVAGVLLPSTGLVPGSSGFAQDLSKASGSPDIQLAAALLGTEIRLSEPTSPECDRYKPSIAYNWVHREYLVVWHNLWPDGHRDIYARRVSESGDLLSWFAIAASSNDRAQPAVAYNATNDEYLVVWMYNANGDGSTYEIWGRTVAWNGGYMNPEFQIITWPNRTFWTPRVAWNSYRNQYLVVWSAHETATLTPTDVSNALLAADGTKLFGTIIVSADQPHQPDVTYNVATDEYLVVWRSMWTPGDGDIRAARLAGDAATVVNPPGELVVSALAEDQMLPAVTTNQQHRYLVVWQHAYPSPPYDWDIRGQELDVTGNLVGNEIDFANSADDETAPQVVARPGFGREYLAVWQRTTSSGEAIWAATWGDAGTTYYGEIAAAAFWNNESPAVAAGRPSFFIVYEGDATGDPTVYRHIYGRRFVPNTVFLPRVVRNR
jgi:hypothetical protein